MSGFYLFLQARDLVAPIETGTATSVMGWGGFVFGLGAFGILIWDRITGRTKSIAGVENKLDRLSSQVEDVENTVKVIDVRMGSLDLTVKEIAQEWRGVGGENGYKNIIRENTRAITEIVRRNDRLDAIREEDERRSGGQHRRLIDRELDNLLPEKREDRP